MGRSGSRVDLISRKIIETKLTAPRVIVRRTDDAVVSREDRMHVFKRLLALANVVVPSIAWAARPTRRREPASAPVRSRISLACGRWMETSISTAPRLAGSPIPTPMHGWCSFPSSSTFETRTRASGDLHAALRGKSSVRVAKRDLRRGRVAIRNRAARRTSRSGPE